MSIKRAFLLALRARLDRVNIIEDGAQIAPDAWVSGSEIGQNCRIAEGCKIHKATLIGNITVGRYTSLWGPSVFVSAGGQGAEIGSFCSIAHHVSIQEQSHNPQRTTTYFIERNLFKEPEPADALISKGRVRIGHDVWIGAGAQVMSGVTIGNGAIVAAGAIVTHNVAPYAVVAGSPARLIRFRFHPEKVSDLLALQWWHWSEDRIRSEAAFLTEVQDRPDE